jgi:hypothetical protein
VLANGRFGSGRWNCFGGFFHRRLEEGQLCRIAPLAPRAVLGPQELRQIVLDLGQLARQVSVGTQNQPAIGR